MDIGVALRVKYKLRVVSSGEEAERWADLTERLIREGGDPDKAGLAAADQLFDIVPNLILKAEADTIEALLRRARCKGAPTSIRRHSSGSRTSACRWRASLQASSLRVSQ